MVTRFEEQHYFTDNADALVGRALQNCYIVCKYSSKKFYFEKGFSDKAQSGTYVEGTVDGGILLPVIPTDTGTL